MKPDTMVTKKTNKPRGREKLDWRVDPDRYPIACADALRKRCKSAQAAFDLAVSLFDMRELGPHEGWGTHELRSDPRGNAATVKGRASTIRLKATRRPPPPGFAEWRALMAEAINLALMPLTDRLVSAALIMGMARDADQMRGNRGFPAEDATFALSCLLPLVSGKLQPPDFSTSDK